MNNMIELFGTSRQLFNYGRSAVVRMKTQKTKMGLAFAPSAIRMEAVLQKPMKRPMF